MPEHVKLGLDSMRAYNEQQTDALPDQATLQQLAKSKAGTRSMAHLVPGKKQKVRLGLEAWPICSWQHAKSKAGT